MTRNPSTLVEFRLQLKNLRSSKPREWHASRALIAHYTLAATLQRLSDALRISSLAPEIREPLLASLQRASQDTVIRESDSELLKRLTGFPAAKALRALCVYCGLTDRPDNSTASAWTTDQLEVFLQGHANPFDLLLEVDAPSLLDLGAGDLSFIHELTAQYLPAVRARDRSLTIHALDRIKPGSSLGTAYQATQDMVASLKTRPGLQFRYWGNQDMFALDSSDHQHALRAWYHLVACWAPANPTFSYEPSRLSPKLIDRHLRETRGAYRQVRAHGEPALEVLHQGRALLFPEWKFEIRGPLALLDVIARRGLFCVLGAVDSEVFWELLAQLVADPSRRPQDVLFTEENLPAVFGPLHRDLRALPVGRSQSLAALTELRRNIPHVIPSDSASAATFHFRDVFVQRGATFPGMPASSTARRFPQLREETAPWFLVLIPER